MRRSRLAATYGDRIAEVYDDWYVEQPGVSSTQHVSVYERADAG
jgi:hypothetical protein